MEAQSNRPYWWQLFFIGLGMICYTICRVGFPVGLAAMGKAFQWTAFEAGVLGTIFLLGQALIDIPAGYWADRFDRKRLIFIGLFGLGLFTALVTLATGFWSALVYRVVFGAFEGVFNIVMFSVTGSILPGNRALINGMTQLFYGIGTYGGQGLVGSILSAHPGNWQLPMWVLGGISMVYAVVSLALFRRQYLRRNETPNEMTKHGFWKTLGITVTNIMVWKALSIHVFNVIANWAVLGFGNYVFIRYRHYDPAFSAMVFGIGFGVGSLMVPFGTVWADKFGRRPIVCAFALWTAIMSFLVFAVAPPTWVMVVLAIGMGCGINALYALGYTITQDAIASASMSGIGIATGMAGGFAYLFAVLGGPIVGALIPSLGPLWALTLVVVGCELMAALLGYFFLVGDMRPAAATVSAQAAN